MTKRKLPAESIRINLDITMFILKNCGKLLLAKAKIYQNLSGLQVPMSSPDWTSALNAPQQAVGNAQIWL